MSDPDDDGLDTIRGILNAVLFTAACAALAWMISRILA